MIELNLLERFFLLQILPDGGNHIDLSLRKMVLDKTAFDPKKKEFEEFDKLLDHVKNPDGTTTSKVTGDAEKSVKVKYEFSQLEIDYVAKKLKELDKAEKLSSALMSLWNKFTK